MTKGNKSGGDLNDIQSQADDLLKSLDSLDESSKDSTQSASAGNTREPSPDKVLEQKSSSSSVKTILVAAGSFAGIAVVIIGGLIALETSKQATLSQQAELAAHEAREIREQAAREQAAREQAAREQAARDQAAREQAAREQAAREQAAREQAAREQAARQQAARQQAASEREAQESKEAKRLASLRRELVAKGWERVGSSGLLFRNCNRSANEVRLGPACEEPNVSSARWAGFEFYCLSKNCSGALSFASHNASDSAWNDYMDLHQKGYTNFRRGEKRVVTAPVPAGLEYTWVLAAAGHCRNRNGSWRKC